jgi:hypothetical protein
LAVPGLGFELLAGGEPGLGVATPGFAGSAFRIELLEVEDSGAESRTGGAESTTGGTTLR